MDSPSIRTKYGLVSGVPLEGRYAGITLYKGIPYGAPPVGPLRFLPPQDPAPWDGVRRCDRYGDACVQPTNGDLDAEPWATDFYYMGNPPMSEDCLYLNVASGARPGGNRPVFMWFHGGGADHGYSWEIEFDPCELALRGIVVVSVGHRLHALASLTLPQLPSSGNLTLRDNMKALEWVIDNISAFGGDPNCITVGGQSAGSGKSTSLALTPLARGHVKRVINQSGLRWRGLCDTREEAYEKSRKYLEDIGIDPDASRETLQNIDPRAFFPESRTQPFPPGLVCDGDIVPDLDTAVSMERVLGELDFLSGSNLGETHLPPEAKRGDIDFTSAGALLAYCRELLGDLYDRYDFESLFPVSDGTADALSRRLASLGLARGRGAGGLMVNRYFGAWRAKKAPGRSTFTYLFSRVPPVREQDLSTARDPKSLMAWHSGELWYTFASLREGVPPARPWEEADRNLAQTVCSYWANFIATGNPNGEGLPHWPASDENYGWMELKEEPEGHSGLDRADGLFLEFMKKHTGLPELAG